MQENLLGEILHNEVKPHTTIQLLHTVVVRRLYHKVSMKPCDEQCQGEVRPYNHSNKT